MITSFRQSAKKTIIHLGPSGELLGGIRTVMEGLCSSALADKYDMRIVPTASQSGRISTFLRGYRRCAKLCAEGEADLLHIHMSENASCLRAAQVLRMAERNGVPTVLHSHGGNFQTYMDNVFPVLKRRLIRAFALAQSVVALTPGWRDYWQVLLPATRINVIPNFVRLPARVPAFRVGKHLDVLYLGVLGECKGTYDLIEAVRFLSEKGFVDGLHVHLAGNGEVDCCKRLVEKYQLRHLFTFHGWVEGMQKESLLNNCSVLVLPSHFESFGIVLLEAMAHGRPVICSDGGSMIETVDDGVDGIVFPRTNVGALARVLQDCLNGRYDLATMGYRGRKKVASIYSEERVLSQWSDLYKRILSDKDDFDA
ncbi:glycosyl transferase group 1 [Coriobacterium glomerans PW2]|uniref:Glycosyl transferase group 1 n=2 Tax=Coriobacterium TaxID=33870 RepID=F2N8B3_CORGP|nr:glycosyl transferase group 1 [Coriobacterium glomerans PW2]